MGESWEAWYLDFEELNELLATPVPISPKEIPVLEACWMHGITAEEALENFQDDL